MGVLSNHKHERFVQQLAAGKTGDEAYVLAGYKENRANASRLKSNDHVQACVAEILAKSCAKVGVTVESVIAELAKIGVSDIRKAVEWGSREIVEEVRDPSVKKRGRPKKANAVTVVHEIKLKSSTEIDDATAGAIAEVKQTKEGVAIKFHDKRQALMDLGRSLGMFKQEVDVGIRGTVKFIIED